VGIGTDVVGEGGFRFVRWRVRRGVDSNGSAPESIDDATYRARGATSRVVPLVESDMMPVRSRSSRARASETLRSAAATCPRAPLLTLSARFLPGRTGAGAGAAAQRSDGAARRKPRETTRCEHLSRRDVRGARGVITDARRAVRARDTSRIFARADPISRSSIQRERAMASRV